MVRLWAVSLGDPRLGEETGEARVRQDDLRPGAEVLRWPKGICGRRGAARFYGDIKYENATIRFSPDFTLQVQQKHRSFDDVKRSLRTKDIKYMMIFPARLRVGLGSSVHRPRPGSGWKVGAPLEGKHQGDSKGVAEEQLETLDHRGSVWRRSRLRRGQRPARRRSRREGPKSQEANELPLQDGTRGADMGI
ncbi:hypothetical protein NDU88_003770 [Pleurodeles waltl]|uniref:Uncharacterized protein n=1 Tax=Pleurodeles waltl TaxID=8319 RepID=A0AAV7T646_PLEWA|nr:hypothetical protein NDU88_003770 [Pleurodeles waltl]